MTTTTATKSLKALKITPRNWSIYANLMTAAGHTPTDKAAMNGRFVVLKTYQPSPYSLETVVEVYDEIDFRTNFRWVEQAEEMKFVPIEELKPDEDGERTPWEPGREDLGAV